MALGFFLEAKWKKEDQLATLERELLEELGFSIKSRGDYFGQADEYFLFSPSGHAFL